MMLTRNSSDQIQHDGIPNTCLSGQFLIWAKRPSKKLLILSAMMISDSTTMISTSLKKSSKSSNHFLISQLTGCQSEIVATVSMVASLIVHVIHHFKQMKTRTSLLKQLITQLDRSIKIRFSEIVKRLSTKPANKNDPFNDPLYSVATILDRRFRFRWLSMMDYSQSFESEVKQSLMNLILDECECNTDKQLEQSRSSQPSSSDYTTQTNGSTMTKKRKVFQYDGQDLFSNNSELSPPDELTAYVEDPSQIPSFCRMETQLVIFNEECGQASVHCASVVRTD